MNVRLLQKEDCQQIAHLIGRNFMEINSKDYPLSKMEQMAKDFNEEKILNIAKNSHTYVVLEGEQIIGTGSISSFWGSEKESILLTIFVLPQYHSKGVGKLIIETLESDELFLRADRIEIPSSITACGFYEKMGYSYKNNVKTLDSEGHYRMEKYR